jgi:hypothetical protein
MTPVSAPRLGVATVVETIPGGRADHPLDLGDDTERVGRRDDVEGDDERCVGARPEGPRDGVEGLPLG